MDKVMWFADKYNLKIIEDNAQSLGAKYKGKRTGTFGDLSILSFYPAKILGTAGDGGAICTNNDEYAYKLRAMRDNGRVKGKDEVLFFGYNSRLDNLHAAILNVKMDYLDTSIYKRKSLAMKYIENLHMVKSIVLPPICDNDYPYNDVWQNFVIRTPMRWELKDYLNDSGIETLVSWSLPMHKQPHLGLHKFRLPMTEKISKEVLSLPMYPELTYGDVDYVCEKINRFQGETD
jgi:dTDP-4-amino-4,6-dideoxygalactose transaminase